MSYNRNLNNIGYYQKIYQKRVNISVTNAFVDIFTTEPNRGKFKVTEVYYYLAENSNSATSNPLILMGTVADNNSIHALTTIIFGSGNQVGYVYAPVVLTDSGATLDPNTLVRIRNSYTSGVQTGLFAIVTVVGYYFN